MNKKVQLVIWAIILVLVILSLGVYAFTESRRIVEGNVYPEVTFEIQDYGTVKMELYPEYAPNTVINFIKLVEKGFYNNKVVYGKDDIALYVGRNSEGEPENPKLSTILDNVEADSSDDYEYTIHGEFLANGFKQNTLKHTKGIVTLIRNDYTQYIPSLSTESYNSGNAQIGIMMSDDAANLNGAYAGFGKITEGMDVIENIYNNCELAPKEEPAETTESAEGDQATQADTTTTDEEETAEEVQAFKNYPVITSATVDTHGINYGDPIVEEAFDYNSYLYNLMSQYYGGNQ